MAESEINNSEWVQEFVRESTIGKYPKYPNESMLKSLFGGSDYFSIAKKPQKDWRVVDVGCGFANNLLPFSDLGCECHGIDLQPKMVQIVQNIVDERGLNAKIHVGENRSIPFPDEYFDLLLSISTLHYEGCQENIIKALSEFDRVLKPGGVAYIVTTAPLHDIQMKAELIDTHRYRIQNYDFRDGAEMFFFDSEKYLEYYLRRFFPLVETGRVTEKLGNMCLDFFVAYCRKN